MQVILSYIKLLLLILMEIHGSDRNEVGTASADPGAGLGHTGNDSEV
ncbi:hypothetical protein LJR153_007144 [Paenibacillus sp. LjRoot153]